MVAPGIVSYVGSFNGQKPPNCPPACSTQAGRQAPGSTTRLAAPAPAGRPESLQGAQELGQVMTKAATVVRHNDEMQAGLRQGVRFGGAGRALLDLRHAALGPTRTAPFARALRRHVPRGQGDPARGHRPRRVPRRRTTSPSSPCARSRPPNRPRAAARPRPGSITSRRTTASGSSRRSPRVGPTARPRLTLRRSQHQPDSAPAAALRRGRRRRDRAGVEGTARAASGTGRSANRGRSSDRRKTTCRKPMSFG